MSKRKTAISLFWGRNFHAENKKDFRQMLMTTPIKYEW